MKRSLGLALSAVLVIAPSAANAQANWSGPYVGVFAQTVSSETGYEDLGCWTACTRPSVQSNSAGGGATIGYDVSAGDGLVIGLMADIGSGSNRKLDNSDLGLQTVGAITWRSAIAFESTVRARIGVTHGKSLIYVTSGLAFAKATFSAEGRNVTSYYPSHSANFEAAWSGTLQGRSYGGGLEYAMGKVSLKAEVLQTKYTPVSSCFGNSDGPDAGVCWSGVSAIPPLLRNTHSATSVKVGLNFRF